MQEHRPTIGPIHITENIFWLGSWNIESFLSVSTYALMDSHYMLIIDPGPENRRMGISAARDRLFEEFKVPQASRQWQIALTGPDAGAAGSLLQMQQDHLHTGFKGTHCHWRSAILLHEPTIHFHHLSTINRSIILPSGRKLSYISLSAQAQSGVIALFDHHSKTLFSGPAFCSMGKNLPFMLDTSGQEQTRSVAGLTSYNQQFADSYWTTALNLPDSEIGYVPQDIQYIYPRYGTIWHENPVNLGQILKQKTANLPDRLREVAVQEHQHLEQIVHDLNVLQQKNFELQEDLVLLQDEGIRDEATGLYNEEFFHEYLPLFIQEHPMNGALILLHLDNLTSINADLGYEEGNAAIRSFSQVIQSVKPETAMLFRLAGPICGLLIPDTTLEQAEILSDTVRSEVRNSGFFIRPVTCSAGVILTAEIGSHTGNPGHMIRTRAAARLEKAIQQGGDKTSTTDLVSETDDATIALARILILEPEPLVARMLHTFLTGAGFECRNEYRSENIIHEVESFKPDVILGELYQSGTDIFEISDTLESRTLTSGIPKVIMCHELPEDKILGLHSRGIFSILRKPIILAELPGLLQHLATENGVLHHE